MDRAYSLLTIKDMTEGDAFWTVRGIATTPEPDRVGDVVEPLGITFRNPLPLLWQHDATKPVGTVAFDKPTKAGITFRAQLPKVAEPGALKDRIDEARQSVQHGLVAGVSIGFRTLPGGYELTDSVPGIRFTKTEVMELSLVTIPANASATINSIKSADAPSLQAALGREQQSLPGVSGSTARKSSAPLRPKGSTMKLSTTEQIAAYEARRGAQVARMNDIAKSAAERGETKNDEEKDEFDGLVSEIKSIDAELTDLRTLEKMNLTTAVPVDGTTAKAAAASRDRVPVQLKHNEALGPGIELVRLGLAMAQSRKEHKPLAEVMSRRYPNSERLNGIAKSGLVENLLQPMHKGEISAVQKATVNAGTTQDATWAGPLLAYNTFAGDFITYLRPQTLVGRLPGLRAVPFNTHINGQTSGGTGYWVGEGAPKPLTKFDYTRIYIPFTKVAGITVISDELVRFSTPSAEAMVRDGLRDALVERMDVDFIDPAHAAVANVSPASMLNGLTPLTPSGSTYATFVADIVRLWSTPLAANMPVQSAVYVMDSLTALRIANMRTQLGEMAYPDMSLAGGTLGGVPVVVSNYVPHNTAGGIIALLFTSEIYLADDGDVTVDASNEASLQMIDNPTNNSATGTPQTLVSMFQTDSTAIRAHRFVYWAKRRALAASYISGTAYA